MPGARGPRASELPDVEIREPTMIFQGDRYVANDRVIAVVHLGREARLVFRVPVGPTASRRASCSVRTYKPGLGNCWWPQPHGIVWQLMQTSDVEVALAQLRAACDALLGAGEGTG